MASRNRRERSTDPQYSGPGSLHAVIARDADTGAPTNYVERDTDGQLWHFESPDAEPRRLQDEQEVMDLHRSGGRQDEAEESGSSAKRGRA